MSAYDIDECIQHGAGQNIGAFLSKPIDVQGKLCTTLNELFSVRLAEGIAPPVAENGAVHATASGRAARSACAVGRRQ
ncbi:MAG: hypothetical protein U1E55_14090 [Paracoccus sp. (in: a-proteobacteria)]